MSHFLIQNVTCDLLPWHFCYNFHVKCCYPGCQRLSSRLSNFKAPRVVFSCQASHDLHVSKVNELKRRSILGHIGAVLSTISDEDRLIYKTANFLDISYDSLEKRTISFSLLILLAASFKSTHFNFQGGMESQTDWEKTAFTKSLQKWFLSHVHLHENVEVERQLVLLVFFTKFE